MSKEGGKGPEPIGIVYKDPDGKNKIRKAIADFEGLNTEVDYQVPEESQDARDKIQDEPLSEE